MIGMINVGYKLLEIQNLAEKKNVPPFLLCAHNVYSDFSKTVNQEIVSSGARVEVLYDSVNVTVPGSVPNLCDMEGTLGEITKPYRVSLNDNGFTVKPNKWLQFIREPIIKVFGSEKPQIVNVNFKTSVLKDPRLVSVIDTATECIGVTECFEKVSDIPVEKYLEDFSSNPLDFSIYYQYQTLNNFI